VDLRRAGSPDGVVATEHAPVVTLGRRAGADACVLPPEELARRGIALRRTERGGLATYHGPGQLLLYPVVDLRALGVRRFVALLEAAALAVVEAAGLVGETRPGTAGVWVAGAKVAAIGVRVSRGISSHGVAINLTGDLAPFTWIRPCGVPGGVAGALDQLGGRRVELKEAAAVAVACLAGGLGVTAEMVAPAALDPAPDRLGAVRGR
jgi:lipoate-protein ligase B